jgi:hypothetical protein
MAQAKFLSLNEIGEASCRVRVSSSAGSGTSIASDKTHVYVLTNAHVVGSNKTATCEFFRYGRKTQKLPGTIIWKSHNDRSVKDFAIIRIEKALFGEFPPRIVPLAPADHVVHKDDYIASAGCPRARWLQLWEGHALSEASKNRVLFTPPPLGGQSGSGVYTVIDGDTYLCAVLTWRIENSKGGAIHIGNFLRAVKGEAAYDTTNIPEDWEYAASEPDLFIAKVPDHWEYVNTKESNAPTYSSQGDHSSTVTVVTRKAIYARGINGCYYLQDWNRTGWQKSVTFPTGYPSVEIVEWGIIMQVRCPGGRCPPIIDPNTPPPSGPSPAPPEGNDNNNPYGVLPPNFGKDFAPDTNKKLEEYKSTIESLKGEIGGLVQKVKDLNTSLVEQNTTIESLTQERDSLSTSIEEKEGALTQLKKDIDVVKSARELDNQSILGLENLISILKGDIDTQLGEIDILKSELSQKGNLIDGLTNDNYDLERKTVEVKSQRNLLGWLFGGTATGGLVGILGLYWKIRGRKRVIDMIDDVWEGKTDEQDSPVPPPQSKPNDVGNEKDLRGLADYLEDRLGSIFDSKIDNLKQEIDSKIDDLKTTTKDIDFNIYNTIDDKDHINVSHSDTKKKEPTRPLESDCDRVLDCIQEPTFPEASDRIKDFMELKRSDGERVEELAFYAHLYKEAVELLKRDRLIVTKKSAPFKVNSQTKAADAIDSYVQNQFLKRVSSATINRHILYHEAMIGFLYKQAIARLKRGEFNVLGYKEVAESVEKWVKTQFMKRMGFEF